MERTLIARLHAIKLCHGDLGGPFTEAGSGRNERCRMT